MIRQDEDPYWVRATDTESGVQVGEYDKQRGIGWRWGQGEDSHQVFYGRAAWLRGVAENSS